jgi:Cys/Met metabolism PLP-dependent enzyme
VLASACSQIPAKGRFLLLDNSRLFVVVRVGWCTIGVNEYWRAAPQGALQLLSYRGPVGPPATTSHVESSALEREAMGIPASLVRYSAGIEHADDLISDLDNALSATRAGTPDASG